MDRFHFLEKLLLQRSALEDEIMDLKVTKNHYKKRTWRAFKDKFEPNPNASLTLNIINPKDCTYTYSGYVENDKIILDGKVIVDGVELEENLASDKTLIDICIEIGALKKLKQELESEIESLKSQDMIQYIYDLFPVDKEKQK